MHAAAIPWPGRSKKAEKCYNHIETQCYHRHDSKSSTKARARSYAYLKHLHQSLIRYGSIQAPHKQYSGGLLLWQVPHATQVANATAVGETSSTAQRVGGGVVPGLLQGVEPGVCSKLTPAHNAEDVFILLPAWLIWRLRLMRHLQVVQAVSAATASTKATDSKQLELKAKQQ